MNASSHTHSSAAARARVCARSVLASACLFGGFALCGCSPARSRTYAGFIDCPVASIASQTTGKIAEIGVREGDHVRRGQLLARLDSAERAALMAQAQANVQRARDAMHEAEHNASAIAPSVRGAQADVARQQAELDDATAEFSRTQRLAEVGASATSQVDAARARVEAARAAVASMSANRQMSEGRVQLALASVQTASATVATNEAALELARVQLAQTEIRCPFDAIVVEQNLQPGEWAAPGTPIVTVEDVSRQWVRIDVEEDAIGTMHIGSPATIRVLAFGNRVFQGHVVEIGAQGEFALNRDVKRGRPDLRTFRVRVGLDHVANELRPGMSSEVDFGPTRTSR